MAAAIWAAALFGGLAAAPLLADATTSDLEPTSRSEGPAPSTTTAVMAMRAASSTTVAVAPSLHPPPPAATTPRSAPAGQQGPSVGPGPSSGQARGADQGGAAAGKDGPQRQDKKSED
jgi:hypothetical protein